MALLQPSPPPELARQQSLCSAIADLYSTAASMPFNDPFSDDMAQFVEDFDPSVDTINEISASQPSNFLFVDPGQIASVATRTSSAMSLASTTRTQSSGDDCTSAKDDARTTLAPDSVLSTTKFGKEYLGPDAAAERTSSPTARAGKAPRSRSTTQAWSPYVAAAAKPAMSLAPTPLSSTSNKWRVAEKVASVVIRPHSAR